MQSFEQSIITTRNKARTLFKQGKNTELIDFTNSSLREIEEQYYLGQDKFSKKFSRFIFAHEHNKTTNKIYGALTSIKIMRYAGHYANGDKTCAENSLLIWPFMVVWTEDSLFDLNLLMSYLIGSGDYNQAGKLMYRLFYSYKNSNNILFYDKEIRDFFRKKRALLAVVRDLPINYIYLLLRERNSNDSGLRNVDEMSFNSSYSGEDLWVNFIRDNPDEIEQLFSDLKLLSMTKSAINGYQDCFHLFNFVNINMEYLISHSKFGESNSFIIAVFMFLVNLENSNRNNVKLFENYLNVLESKIPEGNSKIEYSKKLFEIAKKSQRGKYKGIRPDMIKVNL